MRHRLWTITLSSSLSFDTKWTCSPLAMRSPSRAQTCFLFVQRAAKGGPTRTSETVGACAPVLALGVADTDPGAGGPVLEFAVVLEMTVDSA